MSNSNPKSASLKQLAPCPQTPNCISSETSDAHHYIKPIPYEGTVEEAKARLRQTLLSIPRVLIVHEESSYIHAECTSWLFRFTDDVEFVFDDTQKVIQVRSASRIGYSDLGVNRKRVETIRRLFSQTK